MTIQPPRISVAIPLYRSAPFVDNVSANIEAMPPGIEILVSDRHLYDDAIDRLEKRHRGDRRLVFLRHRDGRDWIDHINDLLRQARGEYWRLLPHDDFTSGKALNALVGCLDEHPETLLAYGPTFSEDLDGNRLPGRQYPDPHPITDEDPWTLGLALDTHWRGHFSGAFKGLLRREWVVERGLWIRRTLGTVHAERAWLAPLAALGRFRFVPDAAYIKRFHPESTHAGWRPGVSHELSVWRVLRAYFRDLVPERPIYRAARGYLAWTTALRLNWLRRPDPLPPPTEPTLPVEGPPIFQRSFDRLLDRWRKAHHWQASSVDS